MYRRKAPRITATLPVYLKIEKIDDLGYVYVYVEGPLGAERCTERLLVGDSIDLELTFNYDGG